MKRIVFVLIMVFWIMSFSVQILASSKQNTFEIDDGVTFTLPEKWNIIPKSIIDDVMNTVAVQANQAPSEYDSGFQLDNGHGDLPTPYILIQIHNEQRVSESEISTLVESYTKTMSVNNDEYQTSLNSLKTNLKLGETNYYKNEKRMITLVDMESNNVEISSVLVTQITQIGYINIFFYSQKKDFDTYWPHFSSIINSITIRPDLLYIEKKQPINLKKVFDLDKMFNDAISGGLVGLFFGGIAVAILIILMIIKPITKKQMLIASKQNEIKILGDSLQAQQYTDPVKNIAENCWNCGTKCVDGNLYCHICGSNYIHETMKPVNGWVNDSKNGISTFSGSEQIPSKKKSPTKKSIIIFSFIITIVSFIVYITYTHSKYNEYKDANEHVDNGAYIEGIEIFLSLDDYKDSKYRVIATKYLLANSLFQDQHYEEARSIFIELESFNESQKLLNKCNEEINKDNVCLITDSGSIDDSSYNQAAWEGVLKASSACSLTAQYAVPAGASLIDYLSKIDYMYNNGFRVFVCPGFTFETAIFSAQSKYPDAKFIIIDGSPNNGEFGTSASEKVGTNTVSVFFEEREAGFLAGLATAIQLKEGEVGFIGGAEISPVQNYYMGFQAGIQYANGYYDTRILIKSENIVYQGAFTDFDSGKQIAHQMFSKGVKAIFTVAGNVGLGAISEAKDQAISGKEAWIIGVDVDQYSLGIYEDGESVVLTSAIKRIDSAVFEMIRTANENVFPGGNTLLFNAKNGGIGIPPVNLNLSSETKAVVYTVQNKMRNGELEVALGIPDNLTSEVLQETKNKKVIITETYIDGSIYEGEIDNENRNGQGTITWLNGDKYSGMWQDGLRNGQGTYTWKNGDKYIGLWQNNMMNGKGKYIFADGSIQSGVWKDNVLVP